MGRFKPNIAGYRELMKSAPVQALVTEAAEKIAAKANAMCSDDDMRNPAFAAHSGTDEVAAWATAGTANPHGERAQAKNKVLTKAFHSTRV